MSEFMTTGEVASLLRLSDNTLRVARMKGTGPAFVKLGRRVVYRRTDVEAWLAARARRHTGEPVIPLNR